MDENAFLSALKGEGWKDPLNHYAYADWLEEHGRDDESRVHREWTPEKQLEAEAFMKEYAAVLSGEGRIDEDDYRYSEITVERLMEVATGVLMDGDDASWICLGFDTPDHVWQNRQQFWRHYSVLTGMPVAEGYDVTFVSCSC